MKEAIPEAAQQSEEEDGDSDGEQDTGQREQQIDTGFYFDESQAPQVKLAEMTKE